MAQNRGDAQAVWRVVDARGHRCPVPTLRLGRALGTAPSGALVMVLADDPMARIDVPHFAASGGHLVVEVLDDGAAVRITVRKRPDVAGDDGLAS